ncbi:hypothetical protein Poly30_41110 [Planctomycetes bacterium Poly30]|uniref:(Na+)-NQR maturation NqrM n=1 Tax=Saltatorellus ferox TaxID=2528018 RepID=A0A518EWU5_9BACT|nr:hypothetical protein Poly30_41110 [Planctomycetes bacterium Poly30]
MDTFLLVFLFMGIGVAAMAVGLLRGKALSGSCGGVGPDGESLADCLCEMQNAPVCDARKELLALAKRKAERDRLRQKATT